MTHRIAFWLGQIRLASNPLLLAIALFHILIFALFLRWSPIFMNLGDYSRSLGPTQYIEPRYDFDFGHQFKNIKLTEASNFSKEKLELLILSSVSPTLRKRLSPLIKDALILSEHYSIDPFWFLSVMKVESHFNPKALSRVKAKGLMQLMPSTAHELFRKLDNPVSKKVADQLVWDTQVNMELGAFYLKKLLRRFNYNYKLATIAYNMGPTWVRRRLRKSQPVGRRNHYWNKVNRTYGQISKNFKLRYTNMTFKR
ncbi:MAG: lytic transglycosylase domain-containing protein [Bacteriovoracaceae bacterium]